MLIVIECLFLFCFVFIQADIPKRIESSKPANGHSNRHRLGQGREFISPQYLIKRDGLCNHFPNGVLLGENDLI